MSTDKKRAHQLLQIVEDSYMRTANLKEEYQTYKNWLLSEKYSGKYPLSEEDLKTLEKYKKMFKSYENNISMEKKIFWYEGPEPRGLGETGACDPEGDPQPKYHDPLDEFLAECKWKGTYFNEGDHSVEGNVYEKGGTYYLSFDGTQDIFDDGVRADFHGIVLRNFVPYLEKAYDFYKTAMSKLGLDENEAQDIVFLGHSLGGALASTLSAAIYLGAFRDIYNTNGEFERGEFERGEFDRSRFEGKKNHSGANIEP